MDADLNGKDELGGEFLVAGDASLEDDSGHGGTFLPKKNPGDARVKDKQLDQLLKCLGNFHLLLLQSLDIF